MSRSLGRHKPGMGTIAESFHSSKQGNCTNKSVLPIICVGSSSKSFVLMSMNTFIFLSSILKSKNLANVKRFCLMCLI